MTQTVIGNHLPEEKRTKIWRDLIELKKSFKMFEKGPTEHELAIANLDKRVYGFFLSDYAKVA